MSMAGTNVFPTRVGENYRWLPGRHLQANDDSQNTVGQDE